MPKVLFTISYGVKPDLRDRYLEFARDMRTYFTGVGKKNYTVYELKGKKNQFAEVFVTQSLEEYDALEDNQDEKTEELVSRLQEFVDDDGMKYTTYIEI